MKIENETILEQLIRRLNHNGWRWASLSLSGTGRTILSIAPADVETPVKKVFESATPSVAIADAEKFIQGMGADDYMALQSFDEFQEQQ